MATHPKEHQERMAAGEGDESTPTNGGGILPDNFTEVVASLPQGPQCSMFPSLRQYRGFWLSEISLLSLPEVHARFALSPTDVLVASFPKCGTTWLKSLCFATARRSSHPPLDGGHPLLRRNTHDCVRNIDTLRFLQGGDEDDGEAPRLLGTHLPYSLLPARATAGDGSGCRIVYVIWDPKDTLVSLWHFNSGVVMTTAGGGDDAKQGAPPPEKAKFEEAFELFCQGRYGLGPQWEHAREYWEASRRRPGSVLCLRYEEMLRDPAGNLRRIAAFMGCPFSEAEEEAGVVRAILELCGMEKQRSLAVNRSGAYVVFVILLLLIKFSANLLLSFSREVNL
ncbi:hypothetical protein C2845_PM14G10890 [Panicum miliaceum]|uniref:Sulfotransferase n=1 Tax=Panicum miliaceum TaxID=4540 RepID=A0A3L6PNA6_PANMI|nr:hypothetical protein C2845_PM14G10890 [Panicum miliaceum]